MKIVSCEVIRDLIPLYVEDMVSEDSKELVETHLDKCEDCRDYLEDLQSMDAPMPVETDVEPLAKIRKDINKRKWIAVAIGGLLTLLLTVLVGVFLTAPDYALYSEDLVTVDETDSGLIILEFDSSVEGYNLTSYPTEEGSGMTYEITAFTSLSNEIGTNEQIEPTVLNPDGEEVDSVYYYQADGSENILLYGEDQYANGGQVVLPLLALTYVFIGAIILSILGFATILILRSNKKWRSILLRLTIIPLSYVIAHLLVTGWTGTTYSIQRDIAAIGIVTIILSVTFYLGLSYFSNKSSYR